MTTLIGEDSRRIGAASPSSADRDGAGRVLTGARPRRRSDVLARLVEGETVVLDRQRQLIHQLNQTATYIWDRCDGQHTVMALADELARAFDVDADTAVTDVAAAVRQFEVVGLVAPATSRHADA